MFYFSTEIKVTTIFCPRSTLRFRVCDGFARADACTSFYAHRRRLQVIAVTDVSNADEVLAPSVHVQFLVLLGTSSEQSHQVCERVSVLL